MDNPIMLTFHNTNIQMKVKEKLFRIKQNQTQNGTVTSNVPYKILTPKNSQSYKSRTVPKMPN